MVSIGICDDEGAVCSHLERMIWEFRQTTNEKIETEVFFSGKDLTKHLKNGKTFDIIFLDIELGDMTGVEIGHMIREDMEDHGVKIVYISSKSGYDRQLFAVQPLNFLTKPLNQKSVFEAISRALLLLNKESNAFFHGGINRYFRGW